MKIPVSNQDFFEPVLFHGMHGPDGYIVENAETGGVPGTRMMAGWPDECKGVIHFLCHDGVDSV